MTSIASIDTSIYSGLIESHQLTSGRNAPEVATQQTFKSSDVENNQVDLSSYYSNIRVEDLYAGMGDNVARSAEDLNNAMVSAIRKGGGVKEACDIQMAKRAYEANCRVYKSTVEMTI